MSNDVAFSLVGAAVIVVALVLVFRLARRDRGIRLTRLGVFLERERFAVEDDEDDDDDEDDTKVLPPR